MTDFGGLAIDGRVVTSDDGDWDQARSAWNLSADQHPAAVAFVESAEDVVVNRRLIRHDRHTFIVDDHAAFWRGRGA